jgi:uncharacterized protein
MSGIPLVLNYPTTIPETPGNGNSDEECNPHLRLPVSVTGNEFTLSPPPTAGTVPISVPTARKSKAFHGAVDVNATTAKLRLVELAEEIINNLAADPQAELRITVEITADFPAGVSDQIRRAVSENAKSLGFKNCTWE